MRKGFSILSVLLVSLFLFQPGNTEAAEKITYPTKVNVSIYKASSLTMTLNGAYQVVNKETGVVTAIPTNTTISVKKDNSGITINYPNVTGSSKSGFDVEELTGTSNLTKVSNGITYRGSFTLKANGSQVEVINYLDMEDYLKGVVPSEMPASWHMEALKAQAIAARSYAANSLILSSTATSQVYKGYSGEHSRTNQAIQETAGLTVKYNGKPIQTFFHSTSGGRTANVGDVWSSNQSYFPYLVSVESPYETASSLFTWSETFLPSTILSSFGLSNKAELYDIVLTKSGANGEVSAVTVKSSEGEVTKKGNESVIRKLFPIQNANYYNTLYSNWFDVEVVKSGGSVSVQTSSGTVPLTEIKGQVVQTASGQETLDSSNVSIQTPNGIVSNEGGNATSIVVSGRGWGHRIGLSQYGAKGFAEKGWTAEQILTHYFKGTTISK